MRAQLKEEPGEIEIREALNPESPEESLAVIREKQQLLQEGLESLV